MLVLNDAEKGFSVLLSKVQEKEKNVREKLETNVEQKQLKNRDAMFLFLIFNL